MSGLPKQGRDKTLLNVLSRELSDEDEEVLLLQSQVGSERRLAQEYSLEVLDLDKDTLGLFPVSRFKRVDAVEGSQGQRMQK